MSTPSEQKPELVELCDYLTRQPRESVSAHTEHRLESENDVPRSPYAPKPAHERAASRLRALASDESEEAPSEIRRPIMADQDLARIEASLRLLHRNRSTGTRLPRGPNIPLPADRMIASAGRESHDSVEQVPAWLTRPRRLEPMIMPPPPPGAGRKLHVGLSITLACFAGALAYYAFMAARPSQSG